MNQAMVGFFDVELVIIILAYLLVFYGETGAGMFAMSQGLLIDIFSVGLLGLFTFIYLIVFLCIILGSRFFDLYSSRGQILVISMAVLSKEILFVAFLKVLSLEVAVSLPVLLTLLASAIASGLVAPFVFYIFNCLSKSLGGGSDRSSEEWT
jgi:hypothetical protein